MNSQAADAIAPIGSPAAASSAVGPYRLVAIDLDGTLLRSDKRLTATAGRAVQQCLERGIHVVLATARPPRAVKPIWEILGLQAVSIHYNGALIHDFGKSRHVFHRPLAVPLVRKLVRVARRADPDCVVSLEILDRWYTDYYDPKLPTETSLKFNPDVIGPLQAFMTVPVTKMMLHAPRERLLKLRTVVEKRFAGKVGMALSDHHLMQLMHVACDKAVALEQVATELNIPRHEVLAIGDAPNDIRMLRWAGLGVAVRNAWPTVKQVADVHAPSNDEDGVAHTLHKYVLGS
ncbi:MAG: Cof-type HAD-IIB family hydrolase [Phycisphaeraceae bacterium]